MKENKSLPERMRELASSRPEQSEELCRLAEALEKAVDQGDAKKILGAWARARRFWCQCTGESLI